MLYKDLQIAFEIEATSNYSNIEDKPLSKEIEYWLNIGLERFVKTRYSGINLKREGFDQSQKRMDDLRTLTIDLKEYVNQESDNFYITEDLPNDYLFLLGDKVGLLPLNGTALECWKTDDLGQYVEIFTDPIQETIDTVDQKLENKLSDHNYRRGKAKPLRVIKNNKIYYYTDGSYMVNSVILTYLKKPEKIDIHNKAKEEYTNMPEHTHTEIVKLAVQAYLENKKNQRYETYINEVNVME